MIASVEAEPCDGATLLADDRMLPRSFHFSIFHIFVVLTRFQITFEISSISMYVDRSPVSDAAYAWRALFSDGLVTLGPSRTFLPLFRLRFVMCC